MNGRRFLRRVGGAVFVFAFVFAGGAVWVVILTGGENWSEIVFGPAYVMIVLIASSIAGFGYWIGEWLGLGG